MRKIKVSYTILNAWAQGKYEDAIRYFFRLEVVQTPAMKAGQEYHERWEQEIQRTKKLPEIFGAKQLIKPSPEQYLKVEINDWLLLSGKIDCYDKPTLYEFKTGYQNSEDIARTKQPGVYAVLSTLAGQFADRCEIHCFNQHLQAPDNKSMSLVYLSDKMLTEALNWVETLSVGLLMHLEREKLFDQYTQK